MPKSKRNSCSDKEFGATSRLGRLASLAMVLCCSCTPIQTEVAESPLSRPRMSPDSVVLDLFFVRLDSKQADLEQQLWSELDEQAFAPEVRRRLGRDGFRIGQVGSQSCGALCELMELKGDAAASSTSEDGMRKIVFDHEYRVRARHMPLRSGQPGQIVAFGAQPEVVLLRCRDEGVSGEVYRQAQGIFEVKAHPQPDGRVRVELQPELHHGQYQKRYVPSPGTWRIDTQQSAEVFEELAFEATLGAGEMLVLGGLPGSTGSLGDHFFTTQTGEGRQREILVVRLAQTQHDPLFVMDEPLPLDEEDE